MKQCLKTILVSLASVKILNAFFEKSRAQHVPIFMLHRFEDKKRGVNGHTIEHTRAALKYLKENDYNVIPLSELIDALDGKTSLPPRSVVLTIDDGFIEQLEVAAELFSEFNFPVSIFLIGLFSSGKSWPWDYKIEHIINNSDLNLLAKASDVVEFLSDIDVTNDRAYIIETIQNRFKKMTTEEAASAVYSLAAALGFELEEGFPEDYQPITWEQARQAKNGVITFGPHSMRHSILKEQSADACYAEIEGSKAILEKELGAPVDVFCFPTGREGIDFDKREMQFVKKAGFRAALSTTPGYVDIAKHGEEDHRYRLPRFGFPDSMEDFIQLCSWVELFKEKLRGNL